MLNDRQKIAIRCAFADLLGSMEAYLDGDSHSHYWKEHLQSLKDLQEAFPDMNLKLSDKVEGWNDD